MDDLRVLLHIHQRAHQRFVRLETTVMTTSVMTTSVMTTSVMTRSVMTTSVMTISVTTISVRTRSVMTISVMTISVTGQVKHSQQRQGANDILHTLVNTHQKSVMTI